MMIYIIFAFIHASKAHTMCINCISISVKLNHTYWVDHYTEMYFEILCKHQYL